MKSSLDSFHVHCARFLSTTSSPIRLSFILILKKAQLFGCIFDGGTYDKDAMCTAVQMCRVAAKSASLRLDNYEPTAIGDKCISSSISLRESISCVHNRFTLVNAKHARDA